VQGSFVVTDSAASGGFVAVVGLGDEYCISHLHDAALYALQFIASAS